MCIGQRTFTQKEAIHVQKIVDFFQQERRNYNGSNFLYTLQCAIALTFRVDVPVNMSKILYGGSEDWRHIIKVWV